MWGEGMWSVVEILGTMVEELHLLEKVALREVREQTLPGQRALEAKGRPGGQRPDQE